MQSDFLAFCISLSIPKPKKGYTASQCEKFLISCVKRYKKKRGVKPNAAFVPEDYCGGLDVIEGLQIEGGSKPKGHYLVGISSEES